VSAAGAELLSTTTAEVGGVIQKRLVQDLPLNGRNFFDLAIMLPHVSLQNNGSQLSFAGFASNAVLGNNVTSPLFRPSGIFAAGNRDSATNVSIDGVNVQSSVYRQATIQEPPSAIEEVKIHVSSTNAEVGNGVAAVNVITKSGTNQWHGEAYEYFRNDKLDANYFFSNLAGRDKPPYRQNQFGGAGGGAASKDKLFFFAAYEGLRVRQSAVATLTPPPEDIRNGDFSNFHPAGAGTGVFLRLRSSITRMPTILRPESGSHSPGNKIPLGPTNLCAPRPTCVDPVTLKFLQDYVLHSNTVIDGIPRFVGTSRSIVNSDQGLFRIDYPQSSSSHIYGRYGRTITPSTSQTPESLAGLVQNSRDQNAVVHWTKIISAATVNDVMFGYARPYWLYAKDTNVPDVGAAIGLLNTSGLGGGPGFSNGYNMNSSLSFYLEGTDNIYHFADDITHVRGRHSLKFGFQATERRFYYNNQSNDKGTFTFTLAATAMCPDGAPGCAGLSTADKGGYAFASYLLGLPISGLFQLNAAPYRGNKRYYSGYAQDSWRVNQRLTVNYGLRYEYWAPWLVPRHTVATFDEKAGQIQYVLQNPLDYLDPAKGFGKSAPLNPNVAETGYTQGNKNFAPRVGFAYTITRSTVFRAAYGIYYDGNTNTNQFSDISSAVGPFKLRYEPVTTASDQVPGLTVQGNFPFPGATAIPTPNSNPLSTFRFVRSYIQISSVKEWSASVQQRFGSDWAAEVSYQGTHAIHLPQYPCRHQGRMTWGSRLLAGSSTSIHRLCQWGSTRGSASTSGAISRNGVSSAPGRQSAMATTTVSPRRCTTTFGMA
jgi:outer membrane receptor protein involved in Fe transport